MNALAAMAAASVFVGIMLGAVYDVIRFSRAVLGVDVGNPFKKRKRFAVMRYLLVVLGDIMFFMIAAAVMSVFFFITGDGRMRGHALFGAFLGFLFYYHTVGRLFISSVEYIVSFLRRAAGWLKRQILKLVRKFCGLPIVTSAFTRYNKYIDKRKKNAVLRKRQRRMKSGQRCKN